MYLRDGQKEVDLESESDEDTVEKATRERKGLFHAPDVAIDANGSIIR